jgi:predicted secreted Zn-dependent protease
MTTRLPLTAPTLPDTFEARWDRWVAKGIRRDRMAHQRAIVALMILASTMALAAAWLLLLQ